MADRYEEKGDNEIGNNMAALKAKRAKNAAAVKKRIMKRLKDTKLVNKKKRTELRARTLKYEKEYAEERKKITELKREARKNNCFYREAEKKVVFVIRLKGVNKLPPKVKSVFRLLRLLQVHNGVFVKVNKATKEMLKIVEPYVTYGYPSLSTVRNLIYKRGYIKDGKVRRYSRKKIQNNEDISKHLGKYNVHGIEDMVYQIYTCGSVFKKVNNFLWAFKLKPPKKGFKAKRHGFNEPRPGDWGNREEHINELVSRMI
ncbi:60S ribosomal protein L7, putative [Plasmodium vinckei]|uniref:50S ribosomal protein L7e n=3 Tax=Plasmodium vinckei TaxID=5860 RepID=W7AGB9_PLAVN|nr:50S ribosomal protein L7e [Plasmodium vinckei petteri]CAD2086089.1 60S ribosomal protein L7, putative [Plasmodium vinckei lentum]CAD2097471.1 60S ribosomal protein L7, putative [Plasmodium vinckei petteri]CAD2097643.1 60S ribosomal protein L7, putative [Plasmodium vinckei]